jgi:mannose-1-phosphate guanylyltransferase
LLGGQTLLAQTQRRISGTISSDRILFALTKKHEPFYAKALEKVPAARKIVQPANRGTLPAILWSLLRAVRLDRQAVVAFLPSDHHFAHESGFASALNSSFAHAEANRESVVLLGAAANRPETEYGWIEPETASGGKWGDGAPGVKRFWEKPSEQIAQRLFAQGCLWNTFVMVGAADTFLGMVRRASPAIFQTFEDLLCDVDLLAEEERMQTLYTHLSASDFSKEVLSVRTSELAVTSCGDIGWSDLGDPGRFVAALSATGMEVPCNLAGFCNECSPKPQHSATSEGCVAAVIRDAVASSTVVSQEWLT